VEPEINEQPRQQHAGHNRPKHYFPHDLELVNGD
jgi:hypothetical protein